jgi:hypothetical protein
MIKLLSDVIFGSNSENSLPTYQRTALALKCCAPSHVADMGAEARSPILSVSPPAGKRVLSVTGEDRPFWY